MTIENIFQVNEFYVESIFDDSSVVIESIPGTIIYVDSYINFSGGGSDPVWGLITGTLSDQTDLQSALDAKANTGALVSYQLTSAMTDYLGTSYTSHTHDYINNSVSSQFQQSSLMTNYLGTGYTTHTHDYIPTANSTNFQSTGNYLTTAMQSNAGSNFVAATAAFNGTNISGTIASNGLSLSVAPGGGAGDGLNRIQAGTQTAGTLATVVFSNSNNVTFGMSNSSVVTASFSQSVQTQGTFNTTQLGDYRATSLNSQLLFTSQSSLFALTANDSLSLGTGYTTHTHNYQSTGAYLTTQSGQAFSASGGSTTFQTLNFANSNGFTFSNSNGSVIGSYTVPSTAGFLTTAMQSASSSNFAGTGSAITNGTMTFGTGGLSLNLSNHLTSQTVQPVAISGSNGSFAFSTVSFGNLNGLSFYTSNGSIVGSYTDAGAGGGISAVNLSAGTTSNNLTNFVLSNANGVSFGLNGSTVTASVAGAGGGTLSGYDPFHYGAESVAGQQGAGTLYMQPVDNTPTFQFDRVGMMIQFSNASNSSNSATLSASVGIYTKNVSSLSLLASASTSYALTASGSVGSYSLFGGIRNLTVGLTQTLTGGDYWVGIWSRTSANAGGQTFNQMLASQPNSSYSGIFGAASNATDQVYLGQGRYSVSFTTAMPGSIGFSQIQGNSSILQRPPIFQFAYSTI
jgi:hypothetical protein